MIARRGVPFPVQDDTQNRTEINPIERVQNTQSLATEATFDYERALPPEKSSLYVDVRELDKIVNILPPKLKPPLIQTFISRDIKAEAPILGRIVADHLDFTEKFKSLRFIASKNYLDESIPPPSKDITVGIPERKTEYPKDEQDWAKREQMNFLDRFFHWLNSVIGV